MTALSQISVFLAQIDNNALIESIRTEMRSGPDPTHLIIVGVGFLALVAVVVLCARFLGRDSTSPIEPQLDYFALGLEQLALNREEERDLRQIVDLANLTNPASMLLSPANLAHAANEALARTDDPQLRGRCDRMCRKLFGEPMPDVPAAHSDGQPEIR